MTYPLVYIVVVNWNLKDTTIECLEALYDLRYPNFKIVVIDNHSQDGSPQAITERFPQVEQVVNSHNLGSTGGYNIGFRYALKTSALDP